MDSAPPCPRCHESHAGTCPTPPAGAGLPDLKLPALGGAPLPGSGAHSAAVAGLPWAAAPRIDYGFKPTQLRALVSAARDPDAQLEGIEPSRDEIETHAGFGVAPDRALLSPLYTVAVLQRRRTLTRDLPAARAAREQARCVAREALVTLGESLRKRAREDQSLDALREICERAEQAEGTAVDRADVQDVAREQEQVQLQRHQQAIEAAERQAQPLLEAREAAERNAQKAATDLERARAMVKRSEIELRALESAEQADAAQRARAEGERAERAEQARLAAETDEQARSALADAQTALDEALSTVRAREAERDALLEEQRRGQQEYEASLEEARGALDDVLLDLAAQAFQKQLVSLDDARATLDALNAFADADRAVAVAQAAPDAYDAESYRAGWITGAVGLVGLLGALGWLLA
jgi:hypothetical protein